MTPCLPARSRWTRSLGEITREAFGELEARAAVLALAGDEKATELFDALQEIKPLLSCVGSAVWEREDC
jgi:hypothetical protein